MKTVTFLKEPLNSINRQARVEESDGMYHIVNANMPYLGTINEWWSKDHLQKKIDNGEVKINEWPDFQSWDK